MAWQNRAIYILTGILVLASSQSFAQGLKEKSGPGKKRILRLDLAPASRAPASLAEQAPVEGLQRRPAQVVTIDYTYLDQPDLHVQADASAERSLSKLWNIPRNCFVNPDDPTQTATVIDHEDAETQLRHTFIEGEELLPTEPQS